MITVNQKYIVLDDCLVKNGGTYLTLDSILESRNEDCFTVSFSTLTKNFIDSNKDKLWILGNLMKVVLENKTEELFKILEECKFIKLEFDYNFCPYRSEFGHEVFKKQKCECPHGSSGDPVLSKMYDLITLNCKHSFFMSERQRAVYSAHLPMLDFSKSSVLSSCFSKSSLDLFEKHKDNAKNDKYAILEGYGGFHSFAKGVKEAKDFCEANNFKFDVLPNQDYEKHIETLSYYKGLIFTPVIHDTCPRCIIEARLLNLEVICNNNCQHIYEFWWKDKSKTLDYLKERPNYFWSIIDTL
jgi:hypothetical protein